MKKYLGAQCAVHVAICGGRHLLHANICCREGPPPPPPQETKERLPGMGRPLGRDWNFGKYKILNSVYAITKESICNITTSNI